MQIIYNEYLFFFFFLNLTAYQFLLIWFNFPVLISGLEIHFPVLLTVQFSRRHSHPRFVYIYGYLFFLEILFSNLFIYFVL